LNLIGDMGPGHVSVGQRPLTEMLKLRSTIPDFDVILVGWVCVNI